MQINKNILKTGIEKSTKENIYYEDIKIQGHMIKGVPVKKDPYTSENILSGTVINKISKLLENKDNSELELVYK